MNNLKRILSLALASVMLVGMMVVGASATSYPDDDAIVNKEAVDTLQALGIMKGDDKGNFNPGNNLKRCEAVKILATIHNKGREVNFGSTVDAPFPDVAANHWALEVISYAKSFGIANGYDDGTFKPENPLTVVQLVRMTLNMMGYTEGQSGRDWEIQTTVLANDLGLFDGLESYIPSANVTRDQAAQIICNSLSAPMANATTTQRTYYTLANKPDQTDVPAALLAMEFETATDAAAVAESYGLSNKYLINKSTKTTTQSLSGKYLDMTEGHGVVRSLSVITSGDNKGKYTMTTTTGTYTVASDYSKYIGEDVKILYKGDNKNAVYGVFPISSVVYDGTVGEYQLLVNADSTNGATINGLTIFTQTGATLAEKLPTANKAFKLKAVDTTGDKVADTLTVEVSTYGAVSFVGSTTINISGTGTLTLKNIDLYEGAKVGDWAIVTNTANGTVVTKAEAVTGTIESTNNAGGVRVAGTWYPAATTDTVAKTAIGKDYDLVLVNGYYVYADTAKADAAASNDLLYVIKSVNGASQGTLDAGAPLARVINAEGKVQDITLSSEHTTAVTAEKFYTYKVESNGTYTLKEVNADTNKAGYETVTIGNLSWNVTTVNNKTTGTLSNTNNNGVIANTVQNLADDAKVIVFHNTSKKEDDGTALNTKTGCESKVTDVTTLGTIEILTGKDVKNWGKGFGDKAKTVAFAKSANGISYVQLLFIAADAKNLPNAAATDNTGFGFVVSDETTFEVVNNQTVSVYTIWDGAKNVTVKDAKQTVVEAGDLVSYEENTDGTINGKLLVEDTDFAVGAVSGWNTADKLVKITKMDGADSGVKSINDYTAILYVDTAKGVGVEGGAAEPMATKLDNGAYVPNVYFAKDANGVLTLLVVDTSNKIAGTEFPNTKLDADAIKNLKPGHYTGTYLGQVDDGISSEPEKYLMFFVYTSPKDAVEYTLTVKNEKDETVSTQKYTPNDGEDGKTHYFVMDLRNGGYNGTNSDGSAAGNTANMLEGNHTYTWTITYTDGAETKTAGRNSFTYNTPKAS